MATHFPDNPGIRPYLRLSLLSLGFTTILTQTFILREFLSVFQGNELLIGMFLATWLILSAIGVRAGKYFIDRQLFELSAPQLILASGIIPILLLVFLYLIKYLLFLPGAEVSLWTLVLVIVLLLFPYCFISGYLFTKLTVLITPNPNQSKISESYGLESLGGAIAGLLFSFLLSLFLDSFQLAALVFSIQSLVSFLMLHEAEIKKIKRLLIGVLFIASVITIFLPLNIIAKSFLFRGQKIFLTRDTPYGNITVTKTYDQYNYYENGIYLFCSDNKLIEEEQVHYVLTQISVPRHILIISGSLDGMIVQTKKYGSIKGLDFTDLNPALISIERHIHPISPSDSLQINIIQRDPRNWIKNCSSKYDAVILNAPDPSSALHVRYFTEDFFEEVKHILSPGAYFSISLSSSDNYLNNEAKILLATELKSLRKCFRHVEIIPGSRFYFIASDSLVNMNIGQLVTLRKIENEYVNSFNINDKLLKKRSGQILGSFQDLPVKVNTDQFPVAFFSQNLWWMSRFSGYKLFYPSFALVLLILLLVALKNKSRHYAGIMIGSFAASSFEIIIIFSFQIYFGTVYKMLGSIVALFMLGLWLGNRIRLKLPERKSTIVLLIIQIIPSFLILTFPFFNMEYISYFSYYQWIYYLTVALFTLVCSLNFGLQFQMISNIAIRTESVAPISIYNYDLFGSAAGIFAASMISLPLLGITNSCYFIASVNLLFVFIGLFRKS
jgi:spermidine synthase